LIFIVVVLGIIFLIVAAAFGAIGMLGPDLLNDNLEEGTVDGCFKLDVIAEANMALGVFDMIWCVS
jgi:hypothetical protein